jgi:hypothetical protein
VTSYAVESSVSAEIFEAFVVSLQAQAKVSATKERGASLPFFGTVAELVWECSFDVLSTPRERVQSWSGQLGRATQVKLRTGVKRGRKDWKVRVVDLRNWKGNCASRRF